MSIDLHPSGDPSSRGWGPGWPHPREDLWVPVTWSNGVSPAGGVRKEIARLVTILGNVTISGLYGAHAGYLPHKGWCWGAENRPITGTTDQPSLHSWGLAVDINAPTNPYQSHTAHPVTDQPQWMRDLWADYGFRNGITYPGNQDPMHYEFMGTPAQAAQMLKVAVLHYGATGVKPATPPTPKPAPKPVPVPVPPVVEEDMPLVYFYKPSDPKGIGYIRSEGGVAGDARYHLTGAQAAALRAGGLTVKGAALVETDEFWALPVAGSVAAHDVY